MSETNPLPTEPPAKTEQRSSLMLAYEGASTVLPQPDGVHLALFGEQGRPEVKAHGRLRDPLTFREALSTLHAVVASDFRYQPKDRTAWLAYQRMRKASLGLSALRAQQEYFAWLRRNDPTAWIMLDPVVSVYPDEVAFEVFSRDEGSWARLSMATAGLESEGEPRFGTTHIDFSDSLFNGLQRIRSDRPVKLDIGKEAVALSTDTHEVLEKTITLPDSWLRSFLQVQSAAALPSTRVSIAPIDLYNVLRHLRLHADVKRKGRALRVELVPGEPARLVLEPWERVLPTTAGPHQGRKAQVIRIWGRRRLMLLKRFLPFARTVELHLLGSGLPSFWVLKGGDFTFTLGLSGFTSASWAQALGFDLLLPREVDPDADTRTIIDALKERWSATPQELAEATGLPPARVRTSLQTACQYGQVMADIASGTFRLRPLLANPIDPERLRYRSPRDRVAHDLVHTKDAVKILVENRVYGEGIELVGEVAVKADQREYRPELLLAEDGQARKASCTCALVRQHGLKEGPCAHILALRIAWGELQRRREEGREGAASTITAETRTYVRRDSRGEDMVRLSLDQRWLRVRWGRRGEDLRAQQLVFATVDEARAAYFARTRDLGARGYLDAGEEA